MKKFKELSLTLTAILTVMTVPAFAQNGDTDFMRSIGNIYVVIAVIVAIFLGLVVFLIYLDRRLKRLEDEG